MKGRRGMLAVQKMGRATLMVRLPQCLSKALECCSSGAQAAHAPSGLRM
jgi:hypothetical protein